MPAFHAGKAPRNKGQRYPADPPTVDEIVAVMRAAGQARYGARLNGLIVVLWRAVLRIHEALSPLESDLDARRGSILVRHARTTDAARSAWTPGDGRRSSRGSTTARSCPSAPCSA
jgi:integrase